MSLDGLFKARMEKSTQMWRRYLSPLAPTVHVQRGKWGLATPTRMLILFSEAEAALPQQSICMYYTLPYASTRRLASHVGQCDSSPGVHMPILPVAAWVVLEKQPTATVSDHRCQ